MMIPPLNLQLRQQFKKNVNLIHNRFSPWLITSWNCWCSACRGFLHQMLSLGKNYCAKKDADKIQRLIKHRVSSSSWHSRIFPSTFRDLFNNTIFSTIHVLSDFFCIHSVETYGVLLMQSRTCAISAVMLLVIQASTESICHCRVKINNLSRHVSFCFHVVMRLMQFIGKHHNVTRLVFKFCGCQIEAQCCRAPMYFNLSFQTSRSCSLMLLLYSISEKR